MLSVICVSENSCGNAYEHLSMGEWREVGQAEPPKLLSKGVFVGTTFMEGRGPTVEAGDLVKANVRPGAAAGKEV